MVYKNLLIKSTSSMYVFNVWLQLHEGKNIFHMTKLLSNIEKSRFQLFKIQSDIPTFFPSNNTGENLPRLPLILRMAPNVNPRLFRTQSQDNNKA